MAINIGTWYTAYGITKLNNGTTDKYETRIRYKVNSQSTANNNTSITVQLQCRSVNSSYKTYGYKQTSKIQGTSLSASSFDMRSTNTWQTFGERTFKVSHNSNGKKTVTLTASFTTTATGTYSLSSGSVSKSVELPDIPRYATSNQNLKSKTMNTIVMNWSSDSTVDYIWYSKNNGSSWIGIDVVDGTSGSYTISGLDPNTTYQIKTRVRRKDSQLTTDSSSLSVTTYNKATINSAPNFELGNNETITYSNPSGKTIALAIYDSTGNTAILGYRTVTESSYIFNFTDVELDAFYKKLGFNNSLSIRVYLRTTEGSNNYYDYKEISITLKGNQKTIKVKVSDTYKRGKLWIKIDEIWKRAVIWTNINGTWKRGV